MRVQDPETQRLTDTQQVVPTSPQTQQTGLAATTPPTSARRCQAPHNGPLSHSVVLGVAGAGGHQKPDFSLQPSDPPTPAFWPSCWGLHPLEPAFCSAGEGARHF